MTATLEVAAGALAHETLAYREVIWHPDVLERSNDAFARIR